MLHFFNTDLAKECGILAATIFYNLCYWCDYNEKNDMNFHDGKYWTYNSKRAFAEQFYYATDKQVRVALQTLRDKGYIECGNYNASAYDRTLWYAITDKGQAYNDHRVANSQNGVAPEGQSIGPIGPINWPPEANQTAPQGQPIPNNKPDNNQTDNKPDSKQCGATARTRTPKEPKERYGEYENVQLTATERKKLGIEFGEEKTLDAIQFLDEYIQEKGYKSKSHYLAMRRWVYQAVAEKKPERRKTSGDYDWANL
jgi:hypothetical protein